MEFKGSLNALRPPATDGWHIFVVAIPQKRVTHQTLHSYLLPLLHSQSLTKFYARIFASFIYPLLRTSFVVSYNAFPSLSYFYILTLSHWNPYAREHPGTDRGISIYTRKREREREGERERERERERRSERKSERKSHDVTSYSCKFLSSLPFFHAAWKKNRRFFFLLPDKTNFRKIRFIAWSGWIIHPIMIWLLVVILYFYFTGFLWKSQQILIIARAVWSIKRKRTLPDN